MNYCSVCAAPVEFRIPEGDNMPRHVCGSCNTIHYTNPKVVVGCIPEWGDTILLCRRAIEPRYGYWTLPAGFLEDYETTMEGAARETREEALAEVDISELYTLINLPQINQVYVMFRGTMRDGEFGAGEESLDVRLCREEDIPWDEIAFPVVEQTLKLYFRDRRRGRFGTYTGDITRPADKWKDYQVRFLNGAAGNASGHPAVFRKPHRPRPPRHPTGESKAAPSPTSPNGPRPGIATGCRWPRAHC